MWHYLTKYEKVSTSSLKCEYISSYGKRRNISFLKTAHWYGLNFLYLFIRPGNLNLKIPENLAVLTFLREKVSTFAQSKWYMYTLWLLIRRHSRSTFAQNSRFLILPPPLFPPVRFRGHAPPPPPPQCSPLFVFANTPPPCPLPLRYVRFG